MFKSFNTIRIFLLGIPIFLTACHSDFGPFPMPSGYTHHDKTYQAPPGPEPVMKKIEHMRVPQSVDNTAMAQEPMMTEQMPPVAANVPPVVFSAWDDAANDLIRRLNDSFGKPTEAVYISPPDTMSPTEMKLEKALRHAMSNNGYNIAPAPGMGPFKLHYSAIHLGIGDGTRMMVTVTLTNSMDETVAEESGIYALADGPVMQPVPEPHVHSGPAMSEGVPIPISPSP